MVILESGNDYLGALKGNQSGLLTAVETNFQAQQTVQQINQGHSRIEKRTVSISHHLEGINMTRKAKKGKRRQQKTGLNRSILDVGCGMLRAAIKYKVIESGGVFVDVPTRKVKPSQTSPQCGTQKPKSLDERIHQCDCGCVLDHDVASAIVCLNYALGLGMSLKDGDGLALPKAPKQCGGFR